ncbi:MAG: response regulator [Actinobacteria bacterium]|nr:response regulator [Actinomycetota bacterium]
MTDHELQEARAQIARLQRRVERERSARQESEEIAERSLRRLYVRQRALDVLTRSASVSNAATDERAAFYEVMTMIVEEYEWHVGHLLIRARDDPSTLVSSGYWVGKQGDPFYEAVRAATVGARFAHGTGVPGRVAAYAPRWEIQPTDLVASRKSMLSKGTVFAFGVMVEDVLVGVLEFLSPFPKPQDPDLLELAIPMGEQLGRVMERATARAAEAHHRQELEQTVTERTNDLLKARDRAEALSRARSALFNAVTHELSTPVHAAQAAMDSPTPDLSTARSQLTLLKQRIDALVSVAAESARTDVGKPTIHVLADLVSEVCTTQHALIAAHGGSVSLSEDPSAAEEVLIDSDRLRSALDTLIAGLRLARSDAQVSVGVRLSGQQCVIDVVVDGTTPDTRTVEVVRSLCQEADGDLHEREGGFTMALPVSRPRLRRVGHNRRVLLVDDTKVTQQLASLMLNDAGLEVDLADDGLEAIRRLADADYGVVLMDIRMPRLDGLSATRRIRAGGAGPERAEVPIIAMTAETAPGAAETGMLAGVDAYLAKPFTKQTLLALVKRYLPEA